MEIDADVAMEIAAHEALVREAYWDPNGKVWTWSIGLTNATGHNVERYKGKPQSLEHCLAIFLWALQSYAAVVREVFAGTPLNKHQFAAALSFTWNVGPGGLRRASWPKHFKAGRMAEAERAFKAWNKAGGKVAQGLVNRRKREADLLFRAKWSGQDGHTIEYSVKPNGEVDWRSARRTLIRPTLQRLLGEDTPAPKPPAQPPQKPPQTPTEPDGVKSAVIALVIAGALAAGALWLAGAFG